MKPIPELIKTTNGKWYVQIDATGIFAETEIYPTSDEALDAAQMLHWDMFVITDYYTDAEVTREDYERYK